MKYFTFLIIIVLIGCNGDNQKKDLSEGATDSTNSIVNHNDTIDKTQLSDIICSDKLSSSLKEFANKIDSIPNPFEKSTCYSLGFFKEGKDSMLALEAYVYFPRLTEQMKSYYEGKGMFFINDKKVAIYDWKESLGSKFYNENCLEPIPPFKEDSISKKWAEEHEGWTFVPPHILYKIKGDSLIEVERYMGKDNYDYYE